MKKNNKPITWSVIPVRLSDLQEWEKNPVMMTPREAKEIENGIRKFGLAIPLVANAPLNGKRRLIDGHQRKSIVIASKIQRKDSLVSVSVPDRILTEAECDELTLRLRKNQGHFDPVKLNIFDREFLFDIGFDESELDENDYKNDRLREKDEEVRARPMLRVLISIPINQALDARKILSKLDKIHGIEVLYGAND